MANFADTINPCAFNFFSSDVEFQTEADSMVTFVKRRLGDDILSVELTKKQIWTCFEEATCEYGRLVHEMKIQSELINVLGLPTGSTNLTNVYPKQSLEFLIRQAEPYATEAFVGGSRDASLGYIDLQEGVQDYNIYSELKDIASGSLLWSSGSQSRLRIIEVFHFDPIAAQSTLLNASNITNFLATNFNYESYVNSTIFYVLPVFEDVLRRGMLETAFKVRRSNYSYEIIGSNLRIFPIPTLSQQTGRLYIKVYAGQQNVTDPSAQLGGSDISINGISGPSNVPLNNIPYASITQPGRQWIRQYPLALCTELLGMVRSKFSSVPIPGADLTLNGAELVSNGRADKEKLSAQIKEWLANLTNAKLLEQQANLAESLNKNLRFIPMPRGSCIKIG